MIRFLKTGLLLTIPLIIILLIIYPGSEYYSFRAEGLTLGQAAPSALRYVRKYYNKSIATDDTIRDFFKIQVAANTEQKEGLPERQKVLSIAFVGDIMWLRNGWETFLDERLRSQLSQYDMVFGNLETPIDTLAKVPSLLPDYAKYNSSPELIRAFRRDNGANIFTALSLANNHAFDRGADGLERTTRFLEKEGILATGATTGKAAPPEFLVIERKGIRIGFYSAAWGLNEPGALSGGEVRVNHIPGLAPLQPDKIDLTGLVGVLERMETVGVDLKILFLHWGYEFEYYPDAAIMTAARTLAAAGADMVIGSHPHLIQPYEIFHTKNQLQTADPAGITRKSLIVYSLGNFVTAMYTPPCRIGIIHEVTLFRDSLSGKIEWAAGEETLVYNDAKGFAGRGRRLLLFKDYLEQLSANSPRRSKKLKKRLETLFEIKGM
jgi:poly-gamma-glutamate capsule biosynthesis protein CapA/YwtB (metallophosphatase superfamily)